MTDQPRTYGIMAEFDDSEKLVAAARRTYAQGYRRMDAYSPFPIEGLAEAIGFHRSALPEVVLGGGILGGIGGYLLQYWINVVDFPLNVGGRPFHSWPSFIPVTFEMTVLGASLSAVVGMLFLNGLPLPYHPVFNVPSFQMASRHRFFLCVEATDPMFDRADTRRFLGELGPIRVADVPE